MKNISLIIILFGISLSNAQEFYICDYDETATQNTIKLIGPNFEVNPIVSINNFSGPILDIAYSSNGKMYGVIVDADNINKIIEINLSTGEFTILFVFQPNIFCNNVVCNANNELLLISISQQLITFNLNTLTITSSEFIGDSTPGDLTYYKGNLIFQSSLSFNILTYDGEQLKTVACGDEIPFFGISNFTTSCGENLLYAFEPSGRIYQYDIESNNYEQVGDVFSQVNQVYGATTVNEYMASACPFEDLEEVGCTAGISEEFASNIKLYPNPVRDFLHIQNLNFSEDLFFTLYSVEGKILLREDILSPKIDLSHLSSGVYLMKIYNKSKSVTLTRKIVKN